jgi:glucan phosphoethanolaminetransferase (alkaline phosphatase superfamily)
MCWFILPFAQEYEDSGEFTFSKKIKESLVMNGILIGMLCVGAILIVIYIIVAASFTISQLPSVFATLVNIVGLTLVSILLGYGLISFPKECFLRKDYKKLVNYCHRQAEAIKSEQHAIL